MNDVLKITGLKTKREAVELGLKKLLELKRQEQIKAFKGKLKWAGDLNVQRMDHADDKGKWSDSGRFQCLDRLFQSERPQIP